MSKLRTVIIAMAFTSIASVVGASTFWGHFSLSAPQGTTDLHIKFNDPDEQALHNIEVDPLDKGAGSMSGFDHNNNLLVGRLGGGFLTGGATVTVKSNDTFNSLITDAWWTRDDIKFGPEIDWLSMKLRTGSTLPTEPIQISNLPLPSSAFVLFGAIALLGALRKRQSG